MSVPTIERAGPTEYQEFCIGQGMRAKSFVRLGIAAAVVVGLLLVCLAYWVASLTYLVVL